MRHQVRKNNLNMERSRKKLMLNNMVTSLILNDKIKTTQARAKALQPLVEKIINDAKKPNKVLAIRKATASLQSEVASKKLMTELVQRYQGRPSGYTRITRIGHRAGDAAPMVQIELIA